MTDPQRRGWKHRPTLEIRHLTNIRPSVQKLLTKCHSGLIRSKSAPSSINLKMEMKNAFVSCAPDAASAMECIWKPCWRSSTDRAFTSAPGARTTGSTPPSPIISNGPHHPAFHIKECVQNILLFQRNRLAMLFRNALMAAVMRNIPYGGCGSVSVDLRSVLPSCPYASISCASHRYQSVLLPGGPGPEQGE